MPYKDPERQRIASRKHYESNKATVNARSMQRATVVRKKIRAWLHEYLKNNPCVDCGESDPVVLEFDHQRDKLFAIGDAPRKTTSIKVVAAEVAKCEVRCANCHRKKTYTERGHTHKD